MPSQPPLSATFEATPAQAGETLVAALRVWLPGSSWGEIRRLIRARRVLVNHAVSLDEARRLTAGERVEVTAQSQSRPPTDDDVHLQYVDRDIVVVEKPAGMTTLRHRSQRGWPEVRKQQQPTLDEAVLRILAEQRPGRRRGGRKQRPRIHPVHRLDRETSGLLVFARHRQAAEHLIRQFAAHSVDRVYRAVVVGHPGAQPIESRLVRDRGDGLRGSTTEPGAGKRAVTHIRPLERLGPFTLLECRLETGRTHQIRIHLAEGGWPVCGDKKYAQPRWGAAVEDASRAPRLALHAMKLGFIHPASGEPVQFEMAIPRDLQRLLQRLRRP